MQEHPEKITIFISHTSKDRGFIAQICEHLRLLGVPIWFSPLEIPIIGRLYSDQELEGLLESAIKGCTHFLLLLDDHFLKSKWVKYELDTILREIEVDPDRDLIVILNHPLTVELPPFLAACEIIDFSKGYYTALLYLFKSIFTEATNLSTKMMLNLISEGSRTFTGGISLTDHLVELGAPDEVNRFVMMARNAMSEWNQERPTVDDFLTIANSLDARLQFDQLFSGNAQFVVGDKKDGYSFSASFFPMQTEKLLRMHNRSYKQIPISDIFLTTWKTSAPIDPDHFCTIAAQYGYRRQAFLWLGYKNILYRYALGELEGDSSLLSTNRKMGSARYGFMMDIYEPPDMMKQLRQQERNRTGEGLALVEDVRLDAIHPKFQPVWQKIIADNWEVPDDDPNILFWGHITHGGILSYSVQSSMFSTFYLPMQLNHLLKCAGSIIREAEFPDNPNKKQYLSISELQESEFRGSGLA